MDNEKILKFLEKLQNKSADKITSNVDKGNKCLSRKKKTRNY